MTRIEKTVFISYRRTNLPWALAIYQHLTAHGYDVFFDYASIDSGDFEKVIIENIKGRMHFLVLLTPSALERCKEPGDWLRREIETAMDEKRNIVPIMLESFDFGSPLVVQALTGKLAALNKYNGLRVPANYFIEAMDRLRERYLSAPNDTVLHPVSNDVHKIVNAQKSSVNKRTPVETEQLTATEWFERGYVFQEAQNLDEAIRCYNEAIRLKPDLAEAYNYRGNSRKAIGDLDGAIADFDQAIRINPNDASAYNNRSIARGNKGDLDGAIADHDKAVSIKPELAKYNNFIKSRPLRVFLCHASQDKPAVRDLYNRLVTEGIDAWLDEEKILPGQDWDFEIENAVETSDAVIICLSNNSVNKEGYVQKEIRYIYEIALEKPDGVIFIIPVRLDDCSVPRRIKQYHYQDFFPIEKKERAYKRIISSLEWRAKSIKGE